MKVVIDTDVGLDDAEAVIFASKSKHIELLALTLVSGNASMGVISDNLRRVMSYLDAKSIPIYESGTHNMQGKYIKSDGYFGDNAFAGINLPESDIKISKDMHSPSALIHYARKYPKEVHFGFIGPLTNLAMAFLLDPEFPSLVGSISIMGGDKSEKTTNNCSPYAEFNFHCDPAAARIVSQCFQSLCQKPILLVDWSVCTASLLRKTMFDLLFKGPEIANEKNKHLKLFSIIRDFSNPIIARSMWENGFLTCDLFVPLLLVDPTIILESKRVSITDVELTGEKIGHSYVQDDEKGLFCLVTKIDTTKAEDVLVRCLLEKE